MSMSFGIGGDVGGLVRLLVLLSHSMTTIRKQP